MPFTPHRRLAVARTTWFACVFTACCAVAPAQAAEKDKEKLSTRALFDRTARSTVNVAVLRDNKAQSAGSGFVIDVKRKWVITNFHVLPTGGKCLVTFPRFKDGRIVSDPAQYDLNKGIVGTVIASDPRCDLALVQLASLPEGVKQLPLAAEAVQPGDSLHLVGHPSASGGWWIYTTGRTRGVLHRRMLMNARQNVEATWIQAQMDCNPGDSGSAVVDDFGEVVGVQSARSTDPNVRGFAFCIEASELKTFYNDAVALSDDTKTAPAEVYEREAGRVHRKGDAAAALLILNRALSLDPSRGTAYRQRAGLYFEKGQKDRALMDGYRAVDLLGEDAEAYNERGRAFFARGEYRRAMEDFSTAVRLSPNNVVMRMNRARSCAARKEFDETLKDLNEVLKLAPNTADAYLMRGEVYHERKDYKSAITDYRAGLKLVPNSANLYARLGHSLYHERQYQGAAEAYSQALKLNVAPPGPVWRSLGVARFDLKQFDQAAEAFAQAQKVEPNNASLWFLRGAALEERGDVDLAQAEYAKAAAMGHEEAKKLKTFSTRFVRVHNTTQEPIKVFVTYQTQTKQGNWVQVPAAGALEWQIAPGQPLYLLLNNVAIDARSLRIWAEGTKSGKKWDNNKRSTMLLVETPYKARKQDSHTHVFE
jgi:tetratricopeptide (TPR) repeat protein